MATFKVKGGKHLSGTYQVSGAKNAGPKLIIAAMLSGKECTLSNIPRISDTEKIMQAIREMGGQVEWTGPHEVKVNCANLNNPEVPDVVLKARHAVLIIGATLARLGKIRIGKIGGDKIGKRPIDRLLAGLESIGAQITDGTDYLEMSLPERPSPRDYTFAKNTHTGTESLILASVFADGIVTIRNAAAEPEVDNLIEFLNAMGAKVRRTPPSAGQADSRTIEVAGVPKLLSGAAGVSVADRLEAATALTLAVMNGGDIIVDYHEPEMIKEFTKVLEEMGVVLEWLAPSGVEGTGGVKIKSLADPLRPVFVKTAIHPGFMTDWQPIVVLLLAYCTHGRSEVHEMIYEQRWGALRELGKMGVKFELFQPAGYTSSDYNFNETEFNSNEPYGAYVWGPTEFKPGTFKSYDVRSGINALLAVLFAKGESTVEDPDGHIDRGYENIVGKLQQLGAQIERID